MPVATTPSPAAATPPANSAAAPASLAVDFMALLGQMTAAPTPASTSMQPLPALKNLKDLDTTEREPTDMVGMMPLSLPVMPLDVKVAAPGAQSTAMLAVAAGIAKAQSDAVAPEAKLLSDLIQPELAPDTKPFEIPQLAVENNATVRQTEAAQSRPVHAPVGSSAWADEVGTRLTMMTEQGKHTASLRLSPEHLGPLEVRITMNDDKASIWFGAAHADTRAAIQDALPRLREMFAAQGLSLADANVSREPPRQQSNHSSHSSFGDSTAETGDAAAVASSVRLGLFDAYA